MTDHTHIDCTNLFSALNPRRQTKEIIKIYAPEYTYLPAGEPVDGWLPKVMRAFVVHKNQVPHVETAGIIGCGPGVDAVLMTEILNPQTLVLTDVDKRIVDVAKGNVLNNCTRIPSLRIECTHGDLCEGLKGLGLRFDLLYENLPNLPAKSSVDIAQGALSASFFDDAKYDHIPSTITSNLLGLHYEFLRQAKAYLKEGGSVICCIGARVPMHDILEIFKSLGYTPEILVQDLVRQFEAERVLAEYSRIEEDSETRFRFFDLKRALLHFQELTEKRLEPSEFQEQLCLMAEAISPEEAAWRHGLGGSVGILGLVIRGRLKTTEG